MKGIGAMSPPALAHPTQKSSANPAATNDAAVCVYSDNPMLSSQKTAMAGSAWEIPIKAA